MGTRPGIARATLQGFVAEALVFPAGLITAAYLTRTLGPARYGLVSLIYAAISPVAWAASTTFAGRAGVKLLADAADWRAMGATLLRANALLGFVAMLVFAAAAPGLAAALKHPDLTPYLWLAAAEIGLMPITRLHRDALLARGQYSWPALATVVFQLARLTLVLALVAAGWAIEGVIVANLVARLLELMACRTRLRVPFRGALSGALAPVRHLIGGLFIYSLAVQVFNRVDVLMIGLLGAPADAIGYYGAAQNLAQAPGLFALVFTPLLIAALRRAALDGNAEEVEALRVRSGRVATALWTFAAPVAAGAPRLAILFFGPAFAPSGVILGWLGIAAGAGLVLAVLSAHEVASGRYYRPLLAAIPMLVAAIVLQIAWIPSHGATGAAWATAGAAVLAALVAQGFDGARRLPQRGLDLARALVGGAAGFLITRFAPSLAIPSPIDIILGCAATGGSLVAIGLVSTQDLRHVAAGLTGRSPLDLEPA